MANQPGLREAVSAAVRALRGSHREMTALAVEIGLPMPAEETGTKAERVQACLEALADDDLLPVARRFLDHERVALRVPDRFALEDVLWATGPVTEIPGRVRREVAQTLDLGEFIPRQARFELLLERYWHLDDDPVYGWSGSSTTSLRARVHRHVFRNPGDWDTEELFEHLGVFDAGAPRFARFLEGLVDPATLPDADAQGRVVEAVNAPLARAGIRLEQTGERDGYPSYELVRTGPGPAHRPKTLIFATVDKPDIRFLNVVDNDIEVLQGMDEVLVYDRPVGACGMRWCDLQQWWQDKTRIRDEDQAKAALYNRLLASMPDDKDSPQREFFRIYHRIHGARVRTLPALLPEVWVHWDHKTVKQRGVDALLNHRMDFLLLLPDGRRVMLEVDGRHHYGTAENYEKTVVGDREMKLRGYEVYRFSSTELTNPPTAAQLLTRFFADLFTHHGLRPAPASE